MFNYLKEFNGRIRITKVTLVMILCYTTCGALSYMITAKVADDEGCKQKKQMNDS